MVKQIITVTGAVAPGNLSHCHSHEHLWIDDGPSAKCDPNLRIDDFGLTLQELRTFRAAGGSAIVDAQPVGCGRDAQRLHEAGVPVVADVQAALALIIG